jgi:hypothetical protein
MPTTDRSTSTDYATPRSAMPASVRRDYRGLVEVAIISLAGLAITLFALSYPQFGEAILLLGQYGG